MITMCLIPLLLLEAVLIDEVMHNALASPLKRRPLLQVSLTGPEIA